jgi:hypothetical protein
MKLKITTETKKATKYITKYRILYFDNRCQTGVKNVFISEGYYKNLKEFANKFDTLKPIHLIAETAKEFAKPGKITSKELIDTFGRIYRCHKGGCATPCYVIRCDTVGTGGLECVYDKENPEWKEIKNVKNMQLVA